MLLELLEKHWIRVERIGLDAAKRGKEIGIEPSWSDGGYVNANEARVAEAIKVRKSRAVHSGIRKPKAAS